MTFSLNSYVFLTFLVILYHVLLAGEIHKIYPFSSEEEINKWSVLADADENAGFSSCTFTRSPNGHALFSGNLSLRVPDDGRSYRAGFCAANAPRAMVCTLTKY